jgi:hypothetical protein
MIKEDIDVEWPVPGDIYTKSVQPMTLKAWEPWNFTRHVLFSLQHEDFEEDHMGWRINWLAGVSALRGIGHVLDKIDKVRSENYRNAIEHIWNGWKADRRSNWIFFDFVEKERNNILKEFNFGSFISAEDRALSYIDSEIDAIELFRLAAYWWRFQLEKIESLIRGDKP